MIDQQTAAALDATYNAGLAHHQAGRLDQARQHYEQVLAVAPGHFDALHMLGVYAIQTGQLAPAAELIGRAIAVRDTEPSAYGNLGNALNGLGRWDEALAASDRALTLAPDFAQAHGNRGQALQQLGRLDEAAAAYARVVALRPTPQAHFNLAAVLRDQGDLEAALSACDRAIALKPDYAEALRSRGVILGDLERLEDGLESLDRALMLTPGFAQAWSDRGVVLRRLGRPADALASQDEAVRLQPDHIEALCGRVAPLRELQRPEEALEAADRAIAVRPDAAQAHNVRGIVLHDLGRGDEALESYDRALALDPAHAKALSNRALLLYERRRPREALEGYDLAIVRQPTFADAHYNQALCRLMLGDLVAGWAQHEWRWRLDEFRAERRDSPPTWLGGESLVGKTILLWAEQGLGDTLQFCRYAPAVAALGAEVILEVQPGLARLMASLGPSIRVITRGEPAPAHDVQTPLMSLPHALGASPTGAEPAYLHAAPQAVAAWAARLDQSGSAGLRVGLCWAGGVRPDQFNANSTDKRRSLSLEAFAPLAGVAGLEIYSLQKGPPAAQLADLQASGWDGPPIIDLTDELKDFADTAAFVENLDLVITCDTAVAHLAGALGKPVWILNRFDACWRWLADRDDSPWYPTARLFRQPRPGEWASVIGRVAGELGLLLLRRD